VKVAFESKQSKIEVLRAKRKLSTTQYYKRVYMRSSKTHAERLIEINCRKMLELVPDGGRYTVSGTGRIEERDVQSADVDGGHGVPNRGRGVTNRGRGNDGRGYPGTYGRGRAGGTGRGAPAQGRGGYERGRGGPEDMYSLSQF
jgi:hypothetical protein